MEIPKEPEDTFYVQADFLGNGTKSNLYVIPVEGAYEIIYADEALVRIKHIAGPPERWEMVEGILDQEAIDNIGEAISKRLL